MEGSNVHLQRQPNQSPRISPSIAGLLALQNIEQPSISMRKALINIGCSQECHVQIAKPAEWLGLQTAAHQESAAVCIS